MTSQLTNGAGPRAPATQPLGRTCLTNVLLVLPLSSLVHAQTIQVLDDVAGAFIDVSGSQPLILGDDEEIEVVSTIGNVVFPAGVIVVANKGGVAFRSPPSNDLAPRNEPLPSPAAFAAGQSILAYWDDFDDKDGDVFFVEQDGRAIVQWHDRHLGANPASTARFQLQILGDPGPDGIVAQIVYSDIEQPGVGGGLSATIGYQDGGAGFGHAQWSFDTADAVTNDTVLSLIVYNGPAVPAASFWGLLMMALALLITGTLGASRTRASKRRNHRSGPAVPSVP